MARPQLSEIGGIPIIDADWVTGPLGPKSFSVGEANPHHALRVAKATEADGVLASFGVTHDVESGRKVKPSDWRLKVTDGSDLQADYLTIAHQTGLVVPIFCLDVMDHGVTPTSPDGEVQQLALARMSEAVQAASAMRGIASEDGSADPSIRLAFFGDNRITADNIGRTTGVVREMAQEARRNRVRVELETDLTAEQDVALIHSLRADNVGDVADTGNMWKTRQLIRQSTELLVREGLLDTLDIKDNTSRRLKLQPRRLGSSKSRFDLVPIVDDLMDGGWDGNVVVEQISHRRYTPMPAGSMEGQHKVTEDLRMTNRHVRSLFTASRKAQTRVA